MRSWWGLLYTDSEETIINPYNRRVYIDYEYRSLLNPEKGLLW